LSVAVRELGVSLSLLCPTGCGSNCLYQGSALTPAPPNWAVLQNGTYLLSNNGAYILVYQNDGNLVVSGRLYAALVKEQHVYHC
jgi:hypothetical protein